MLPAGLLFLTSSVILVEKNGNNKRIECLSNDSTILISVPLCLCKEFHIVYNCCQFELVYLLCFLILTSFTIVDNFQCTEIKSNE